MRTEENTSCARNGQPPLTTNLSERAEQIDRLVVGWMVPLMKRTDPHTGEVLNGLGPQDFARVRAGHGCPKCLAKFDTYLPICPVCGYERNILADVQEAPQHWVDHLADRHAEDQQGGTPVSFDEFVGEVLTDSDIEHRQL